MSATSDRFDRLLAAEWYTPEQLADLVDMTPNAVRTAVYENRLQARVVDGHIIEISRDAAIDWLKNRAQQESATS